MAEQTTLEVVSKEVANSLVFHFFNWGGWQDCLELQTGVIEIENIDLSVRVVFILGKRAIAPESVYAETFLHIGRN